MFKMREPRKYIRIYERQRNKTCVPSKTRIELENGGLYILCKNLHAINVYIREKSRPLLHAPVLNSIRF